MYKNDFKIQILLRMFTLEAMSCHKRRSHLRTDPTLSLGRHVQMFFFLFFKDTDFPPVSPYANKRHFTHVPVFQTRF